MHPTRIDLPSATREKVISLLNQNLVDSIDLALQAKQAHWNVKGVNFIALHELFDKVHEAAEEAMDELAERVTALGGTAEGTVQVVHKRTRVAPYPTDVYHWRDHVAKLADAVAAVGKNVRVAIDESDKLGDKDTADLFTEISRELDKQLWFIEAHIQVKE
jgi:starvation-inducible DNA-binding protein